MKTNIEIKLELLKEDVVARITFERPGTFPDGYLDFPKDTTLGEIISVWKNFNRTQQESEYAEVFLK